MGVPLLGKLIDLRKSQLFSPISLQNTVLVIDGKSFCYQVYDKTRTDFRFGGDYSVIKNEMIEFLDRMAKCGIRPIFVFDGSADKNRVKSRTMVKRGQQVLKAAKDASIGKGTGTKVMPALIWNLSMDFLRQHSINGQPIDVFQCAGEADGVVVALANSLKAPILSQDSDYFLLHSFGYIPFDKVIWVPIGDPPGLKAEIYELEWFLDAYEFPCNKRDLLPIFAFLCGHEYSDGFDKEISKFRRSLPQVQDADLSREHQKMLTVLNWLKTESDIDQAIQEIIRIVDHSRKEPIREAIGHLIEVYDMAKIKIDPRKWKKQMNEMVIDRLKELNLPDYLIDLYVTGRCSPALLAIRQDQKVLLPALMEDFSKPSVYECGLSLRSFTYAILLRDLSLKSVIEIDRYQNNDIIKEYDRRIEQVFAPDLATIADMSAEQRQEFFVNCFNFTDSAIEILSSSDIPSDLRLFAFSFIYWRRIKIEESQMKTIKNENEARALLLCAIAHHSMFGQDSNPEFSFDQPPFSTSSKFDPKSDIGHVHSLNQWQIIYMSIVWLDTVLNHPFGPSVPVELIFHGRIAFNLFAEFTNGKKKNGSLTFFNDKRALKKEFDTLWFKLGKCM